jgi:uncharacterized membrane protein YoaK (UPF0700 family)
MSKEIDWIPNADLPSGNGATRQEFDATVGVDQLAIETTPWGDGDLVINGTEVARVSAEETQMQAFQDLQRIAQTIDKGKRDAADHIAPNPVNRTDKMRDSGPVPSASNQTIAPAPMSQGTAGRALWFLAQIQEHLAAGLAMIAGFVDAYGAITYSTYLSFMSGNTTQTGYRIGQGNFAAAVPAVVAIVFFFGGSFAGALLADYARLRARRLVFGVVAAALALIIGLTQLGLSYGGVHIAIISFAMGLMNIALSKVGAESVSLTFVTGALSKLGLHLALAARRAPLADSQGSWDTQMHRALILAGIWGAFLAGALLSGVATPRFGVWVLLAPTLVLAALAVMDSTVSAAVDRRKRALADQTDTGV